MELEHNLDFVQISTEEEDLSQYMDEKDLDNLGLEVYENYKADEQSRSEYIEKSEEALKLALQVREGKSFPWPNASNVKYPLMTTASMQFAARAYASLIPSQRPVKGKVVGFDKDGQKLDKAIRISKHMSYQLLEEMEGWEEDMDKLCMIIPILGCAFKKTYFDPVKEINKSELVLPKQLVVDYWTSSLEDASRISHVLEFSKNDLIDRQMSGLFRDIPLPEKGTTTNLSPAYHEVKDEVQGTKPSNKASDRPYEFIEQQCWYDFDGDGYDEPYIVYLSLDNQKVYRIIKNFDPEKVKRTDEGDIYGIESIKYFTKFSFIPNPDGGFYDIGFGILLTPTNEAVNTIINQLIDAGTLQTTAGGFLGRGIRFKKGSMSFSPNEWKQVNNTGDDLRKAIVPLPVNQPSQVLFSLLGMLIESGQQISSVSDLMMGENPGQNQPASTTMAVLEQGLQVYSGIYKRLYRSLTKEFKKLYDLNADHLPIKAYFQVLDISEEEGSEISAVDYDKEQVSVMPTADPNVASQAQKLLKAQGLLELVQLGTVNPVEVTKRILEAQEQHGIEALMTLPEPQPDPQVVLEHDKFELEQYKAKDESELAWAELAVKAQETEGRLDLEEIRTFLENVQRDEERRSNIMTKMGERKANDTDKAGHS